MASRPEMSCDCPYRNVEVFCDLTEGSQHVAVLAVLAPEPRLVEVLTPLEERLRLLSDDSRSQGMAIGAHGRGLDLRISHRLVGRCDLVWPSNPSIGREMAAGTRQSPSLLCFRSRGRLADFRFVDVWDLEGLRKVADVTRASLLLSTPGMSGKGVSRGEGMCRRRGRDVRWQSEKPLPLWRLVQDRPVLKVAPKTRCELAINGLVACPTHFGRGGRPVGKIYGRRLLSEGRRPHRDHSGYGREHHEQASVTVRLHVRAS